MAVAMLAFMLAAVPVEAGTCYISDVFLAGANFSSPLLVVDLEGCTVLYLNSSSIGDSGAAVIGEALKGNAAVTTLYLSNNNIGDSGAAAIAEALKNNTALATLGLDGNTIGDSGAAAIAEALKNNTALATLGLDGNTIGDSGAAAIAEALKSNTALATLGLGSNTIGDSGAVAIAEVLKNNTAVTMDGNTIGDSGAVAIAEVLKGNTALTYLNLHDNNIGRSGVVAIAEALKSNTALTELYLGHNPGVTIGADLLITESLAKNAVVKAILGGETRVTMSNAYINDNGAVAIAAALKGNTALTYLNLHDNNIGPSGAVAIAEALKSNTALTELYLYNNDFMCSDHGHPQTGIINIAGGDRICKCSGLWSGAVCDTDVPAKAVFSVAALAAFVVFVANPTCIRPYRARKQAERQRKRAERAFGLAHPIKVTTVGGDAYTLEDWGHCKDLKLALQKLAPPGELGDPSTFMLLDNNGWIAPPGGGGADATAAEVDTKYGSAHRANMVQSAPDAAGGGNGIIEMTLVYKATGGGGVQEEGPAGEIAMTTVRATRIKGFGKNTFVGGTHATRDGDDDDDELLLAQF